MTPVRAWTNIFRDTDLTSLCEWSATLFHEIESPLAVVLHGLSRLERKNLSERDILQVELTLEEATRMHRLIMQSQALTKYRHTPAELQRLELNTFLRKILYLTQHLPIVKMQYLKFHSSLPEVWVSGNCDRLKQVFINLIQNACEAVPTGSEILCQLAAGTCPGLVRVDVHNGGQPIHPEMISELTKPFVSTKSYESGPGLTVVDKIVEAHQGKLLIQSSQDEGTTISVQLPIASSQWHSNLTEIG